MQPPEPDRRSPGLLAVRAPALALALLAWVFLLPAASLSSPASTWDLAHRDQVGQRTLYNRELEGGLFGLPVELGDLDGDGQLDLVLAPMAAATGAQGDRPRAGQVYAYRGDGRIEGLWSRPPAADCPPGLTLWGARTDDILGTHISTFDLDGDGAEDLIAGAANYDGPRGDRDNCGGVFIVPGREGLLSGCALIDLAAPPAGVTTIVGAEPGGRLGIWAAAGDLDGDGLGDLILGADHHPARDPNAARFHSGLVTVVYGRPAFPAVLDLAAPDLTGVSRLLGRDREDHFGSTVYSLDLDRDGLWELVAAAATNRCTGEETGRSQFVGHARGGGDGPRNEREDAGEVFVFFGLPRGERFPTLLDLAAELPPAVAGRVTVIYGGARGDLVGEEIASGDFDGDGQPDLALGGLTARSPRGPGLAGVAHVLHWRRGLEGREIDLALAQRAALPLAVSSLYGRYAFDILGDTLAASDLDHDGRDDLAVGVPHAAVGSRPMAGLAAAVAGRSQPWPDVWFPQADRLPPGLRVTYLLGPDPGDLTAYSMAAGDYDRDGYDDLLVNAMHGDGEDDLHAEAGEAYLVSGYRLAGVGLALSQVTPAQGGVGQPVPVMVLGRGFTTDADTRLFAGTAAALEVRVRSGQLLQAVLPASALPGPVEVRVETRYGTVVLAGGFTYVAPGTFRRGDANHDGRINVADAIAVLDALFRGAGPLDCADAGDANDDGRLELDDVSLVLAYLFRGGPAPEPPFAAPGADPTPDRLGCP